MSEIDRSPLPQRPCRLLLPRTPVRERRWGFWQRLRYRLFG